MIPALFNIMVGAFGADKIMQLIEDAGFVDIQIKAQSQEGDSTWLTAIRN